METKEFFVEEYRGRAVRKLPDDIACQLGHIASRWADLEQHLKVILYNLVGAGGPICRVVIGTARAEDQLRKIQDVLFLLDLKINVPDLDRTIADLEVERDAFVHGNWLRHPTTDQLMLIGLRKKWNTGSRGPRVTRRMFPEGRPVTKADMEKLVSEIDAAIQLLATVSNDVIAALSALRDKPRST